jgi:hypothetical protein
MLSPTKRLATSIDEAGKAIERRRRLSRISSACIDLFFAGKLATRMIEFKCQTGSGSSPPSESFLRDAAL